MTFQDTPDQTYDAARHAVAWADWSDHGWLRVAGPTRLDFLQRLSTNDFRGLATGGGLATVLASATGRVVALLFAYGAADAIYLRTPAGRAAALASYLNNLIFWNDQVEIANLSAQTAQIGLFGPQAGAAIARICGVNIDGLPAYGWHEGRLGKTPVTVCRGGALEAPDWTLVTDASAATELRTALAAAPELTPAQAETLRVERGIPAWGHELNDQVTPLEAGLDAAISDRKGCYTGQEVIARQRNYDKITRRLAGLRLPPDTPIVGLDGATVGGGSGRGGFVGTAVWSPALGCPVALAIVPRDLAAPGSRVTIKHGTTEIAGEVIKLPLIDNE